MKHEDITEVSDPHQLTIDVPEHGAPEIRVLKGQPTDEELAAVVSVLATVCGAQPHPGPQELNLWGHPVDKLRYPFCSWQLVTLKDRTHVRR
ncbi:MAG: acyl-CoA carboxylase subunit epsilon [Mycobacterium sp.]|nr:acyl-CoA carboxylase subunit epsilon [Mycobacterium sp.]